MAGTPELQVLPGPAHGEPVSGQPVGQSTGEAKLLDAGLVEERVKLAEAAARR